MTDVEFNKLKRRVMKTMVKWRAILGLARWRDTVQFVDRFKDDDDKGAIGAECVVRWPYRRYLIYIYMPVIAAYEDETLEQLIVHELCHVLLDPLCCNDVEQDTIEAVTTDVEMALWNAHRES